MVMIVVSGAVLLHHQPAYAKATAGEAEASPQ
jgi:hypothetical protein